MIADHATRPTVRRHAMQGNARLRHYVDTGPGGDKPEETTLCGEPWDQLHVPHNGTICEACIDVLHARGKA
jgi:hypothetical protein